MKKLEITLQQIISGQFEFSRHAFKRAVERNISEDEIRTVGANAIVIEDYPEDKYAPSCLLLGFTATNRPLHIQISLAESSMVKIVTLYEPDQNEWIDYSRRRV
jgi:Domain of unknown function (DUF4258)